MQRKKSRARAYSLPAMLSSNSVFGGNDDQACNDKNINNNAWCGGALVVPRANWHAFRSQPGKKKKKKKKRLGCGVSHIFFGRKSRLLVGLVDPVGPADRGRANCIAFAIEIASNLATMRTMIKHHSNWVGVHDEPVCQGKAIAATKHSPHRNQCWLWLQQIQCCYIGHVTFAICVRITLHGNCFDGYTIRGWPRKWTTVSTSSPSRWWLREMLDILGQCRRYCCFYVPSKESCGDDPPIEALRCGAIAWSCSGHGPQPTRRPIGIKSDLSNLGQVHLREQQQQQQQQSRSVPTANTS